MESAKLLLEILESLLGPDGVDVLGEYELLDSSGDAVDTVPSIQVRTATEEPVVRRMIPLSGIECTVEPISDYEYFPRLNKGGDAQENYTVYLDQHDPYKGLNDALNAIYTHPGIRPFKKAIIRSRVESKDGILPARALLVIPHRVYMRSTF